jgi:predicted small lipoprotein YifL
MCNRLHLLLAALATALTACGGDLTLPPDGSPVDLRAFSGDGQEATVGSDLPHPLVVRLTDASAQPVFGATIVFAFQSEIPNAQIDPAIVTTDSGGLASSRVRLGTTTGLQTVEARVATAVELRATFDVTALAQENPGGGGRGGRGKDKDHDDDDD